MVRNINKIPRGYARESTMGRIKDNSIYIGLVKRNDDPQKMGRLAVWIPELSGDPRPGDNGKDAASWIICSYGGPFAGASPKSALVKDATDMDESQTSYGFWMVPPDIDNQVLVCFVNGDMSKAFWIGCVYQQFMNHMVPGIAGGKPADTFDSDNVFPPVVEYNKFSSEKPTDPKRPTFKPLAEGLSKQGLFHDPQRGVSTASAQRAPVSKVYGWNTPRGHSIYIDDDNENEYIRFRTRGGAQILINDTSGFVYINSRNGNSWAEISDKGVDIYSAGSVSLRAEGSLNLHADGSLNIEADGNLNLRAGGNLTFQSAVHTMFAGNGNLALEFGGAASVSASNRIVLGSGGDIQLGAGGSIYNGAGGDHIIAASKLLHNTGNKASVSTLHAEVEQPTSLPDVNGTAPKYQTDSRPTIVKRLPTHEPFHGHQTFTPGSTTDNSPDVISPTEYANATQVQDMAYNGNAAVVNSTVNPSNFTNDDITWMAICMFTEAGGESDDGKAAVARVILRRQQVNWPADKNGAWTGIKKHVLAFRQFSYFWFSIGGSSGSVAKGDWATAEKRGIDVYTKQKNTTTFQKCVDIAKQVTAGTYAGGDGYKLINSNKCTQYHATNMKTYPTWAASLKKLTIIGGHIFYV